MARARKTLEQLKQERKEIDAKIRRMEKAETDAKEKAVIDAIKSLGLMNLSEEELKDRLKAITPKKEGQTIPQEQG